MKKEAVYRSLTVVTPIVAFLCVGGASVAQWNRLKQFEGESRVTEAKLAQIDRELHSYEAMPPSLRYPTVVKTPREQAQFLDALRANADACHVQLIRWSNTTPPPAPAPTNGDKSASALPTGVSAIVSIIEVSGRSDYTRQFLYNVIRSRRLMNMSDIKWVRDAWPTTHLTFTLTRYVAPAVQLPVEHTRRDRPDGDAAGAPSSDAGRLVGDGHGGSGDHAGTLALPNPMDAPGIAHGSYQSKLEDGVSKLNDSIRPDPSVSPRPPAVSNTKR